jgi:hypothetical protein
MTESYGNASPALVEVALRHAASEGAFDLAGTMATLEDEPVYELFPVGLKMVGMDMARRYYEHYFANIAPRIVFFELLAEWINENGVLQEYTLVYRFENGAEKTFRILGILTFGKTLLSGERIYADEELLKDMFAPVWDALEPVG